MRTLNIKSFLVILTILICTVMAQYFDQQISKPPLNISKQKTALNFNRLLKPLSFGHARILSSILWITTLIEGDIEHYKGSDNSWMYYRFLSISLLEPKFYKNYSVGGKYLSIVKDDVAGADDIYQKGLTYYPSDYWLNYNAGFNAAFELHNFDKAILYYEKIVNDDITKRRFPHIISLFEKLKLKSGSITLEDAYSALLNQLKSSDSEIFKKSIEGHLYSIKAEIDLKCLNSQVNYTSCDLKDYEGTKYIKNEKGEWISTRPWKKFKIHR